MNILETVENIMRDIFDDENLVVSLETTADNIEEWDSLSNMNLIVEIENQFNIQMSIQDLESMKSVSDIVQNIKHKL
jgi:acyl carrier protein